LVCGGLLAAHALRAPLRAEPPRSVALTSAPLAQPPVLEPPQVEPSAASPTAADLPPESPSPATDSIAVLPEISPERATVASAEPAPNNRGPSQRELMAALHATPVSMFSTSWCPHCERARRFFHAYGLSVVDHDVDADAQAAAELKRRSGGRAVPLIDVDGRELRGFDEAATKQAVVASVERRLGISGVKLVPSVSN
jgi:glutaredoxin